MQGQKVLLVPVACKACPCGHLFRRTVGAHKVPGSKSEENGEGEVKCRRTERIRRERPDYFNALHFENHLKKIRKRVKQRSTNSTSSSTNEQEGDYSNSEESNPAGQKKRGRPKGSVNKKEKDEPKPVVVEKEEDVMGNISPEKVLQYSIILAEINRKLCGQQLKI
ncbi:uncharacterized protein LOC143231075 isoform X2 [Tachypleus tridentatus]|uniref:uncharacterized protein LOC143231075 isoform X2 n=1 Tax=Tachypleus tridentatus TaxID=6853 RepID=UPI003FD5DA9B